VKQMDRRTTRGARWRRLACCLGAVLSAACSAPTVGAPAVAAVAPPAREPPGPIRHAIVITIDGLLPEAYRSPEAHGLQVPVLRRLVAEGASSPGALSVFPAATYPAHTAIASGVNPRQHGIVTNRVFDPLGQNAGVWRWYAEDVKVPRLWDIARAAGYSTALDSWPVTVGANATYHVPEYWRARGSEEWKLLRVLSTPGLLERVARAYPSFAANQGAGGLSDEAITDVELALLTTTPPHLSFLHLPQVDGAQHEHGLWSAEARAAIENADRQVGRVLETIEHAGLREQTALVVASDHGFASVHRCLNPNALLRRGGLIELNAEGHVTRWDAMAAGSSGSSYVYLMRSGDAKLEASVRALFEQAMKAGQSGIRRIFERSEIEQLGGDPNALLALEAEPDSYFSGGHDSYETPPDIQAVHGYDPNRPEMKASLLLFGPNIPPGQLEHARLIDIAPTVASWLGLEMRDVEGRQLDVTPTVSR